MGKEYLVEGAKLVCIQGGKFSLLKIPNGHGYVSGGKRKANCKDCKACVNIDDFGECKKNETTHLCKGYMELAEKWENVGGFLSKVEKIDGEEAITMDSVLICKRGGIIMPITSGQGYEEGVDWDAFIKRYQKVLLWAVGKNLKCHIFGGDPINLNTGNYIYEKEDLVIRGITELSFHIFYNSMDTKDNGCLGEGWRHNYELYVKEKEGLIYLYLGDGQEISYKHIIGDLYASLFGNVGIFTKKNDHFYYRDENEVEYVFDEKGCLCTKKDRMGNTDTFIHNKKGQLLKVCGSNGGELNYFYNEEGHLVCVKDHTGREVHLTYQYGKLCSFKTALNNVYSYTYNENGKLESVITPRGIEGVKNEYDGVNRIVKQTLPDGGIIEMRYDDKNNQTYMKEQNGNVTIYESDEKSRNVRTVYEDGEEVFNYNNKNQVTLYVDKNGNQTKYEYDNNGNLKQIENALGQKIKYTYDKNNQLTETMLQDGAVKRNFYDQKGNLVKKQDSLGNSIDIEYNAKKQPVIITQKDGSKTFVGYDDRGNIKSIVDAMGNKNSYKYDELNRVIEAADGNGNKTSFLYDKENRICESINALGDRRSYKYNQSGKLVLVVDYDNYNLKLNYDNSNRINKYENKEGFSTSYSYDVMGNVKEEVFPNGTKHTYSYDRLNRMIKFRDEMDNTTRYEYDANGNCTKIIESDGAITSYSYDKLNRILMVEKPDGITTSYEYNIQGQVAKVIYSGDLTEEMEYDSEGKCIKQKDIYGNITTYIYNTMGMMSLILDGAERKTAFSYYPGGWLKMVNYPDGTYEEFFYDGNGNIIKKSNQEGYDLLYSYDSLDRIVKISSNIGEKIEYEYDAVGNLTIVKDGNGNVRKYSYSPNGEISEVEDAEGNRSIYSYDCMGNLISVEQKDLQTEELMKLKEISQINERQRHITFYERDAAGQLVSIRDAMGNKESYFYDNKGRMIRKVDKDTYETQYSYDYSGNIKRINYADGREVEYEYNSLRQLIQIKDWLGITNIESDEYGRVIKVTDHNGNSVGYKYGSMGETKEIIYPDGDKAEYKYDACLRLQSIRMKNEELKYRYNENGNLEEKTFPGGIKVYYQYDKSGKISKISSKDHIGVLDELSYTYDSVGNKISVLKNRRGIASLNGYYQYHYSKMNQLTEVEKDGKKIRKYCYDGFGNRIKTEVEGKISEYKYNCLNQVVSMKGDENKQYYYDKRGNLTSIFKDGKKIQNYEFDASNRISYFSNSEQRSINYIYNGLGQRVGKRINTGGGKNGIYQEEYVTDLTKGFNNLLQETKGQVTKKYVWDDGLVAINEDEKYEFCLRDDLGTPVRFWYHNGKLAEVNDYDEFGNLIHGEWEKGQRFGFTGYQKDAASGNYFAQAREYIPAEGRFASADAFGGSIGLPISLNHYLYCFGNPLIYLDLFGYYTKEEGREAHELLQNKVEEDKISQFETEFPVTGYEYSETGKGKIDILLLNNGHGEAEVYEIKPITQYKGKEWWQIVYDRPSGVEQRKGYVRALRDMGYRVKPYGRTFNPNNWTIPSIIHEKDGIEILYRTFPDEPGMIYWSYVKKPKDDPSEMASVKNEEKPKDSGKGAEIYNIEELRKQKEKGEKVAMDILGIAFILEILLEILKALVPVFLGVGAGGCDSLL